MKVNKPLLAMAMLISANSIAQYPTAFSWNAAPADDQKIQGPCHIFAVVSTVETWYRLLYGSTPGLSQAHLFSPCASADPVSTTEQAALTFIRDVGVVDDVFLPYANNVPCTQNAGTAPNCTNTGQIGSYYNAQLYGTNTNALINCGLPYANCSSSGNTLPTYHYRIGGFQELPVASYTTTDQLKRAIMNHGPIALWMRDPSIHGNTNHAYCLYGWNGSNWLLTDSWPCGGGSMQTSLNLVSLFQQGLGFKAFVLTKGATKPAVYREQRNGTTWVDEALTPVCPNIAYSNAFTISGGTNVSVSGTTFSVSNIGLLDNPTVEWSYTSTDASAVNFSAPTGSSVTVNALVGGSGQIRARIKRPNGLCETISLAVTVSSTTIPFTYTKTQDQCIGGVRRIVYQVTSSVPINCVWDFRPSPGSKYTTSINGCTFTMNYTSFNTSYGLLVSVTSPSFPGQTNGATAGGPVLPCSGFARNATPSAQQVIQQYDGSLVAVYPNPATDIIRINLAADKEYYLQVTDAIGKVIMLKKATGMQEINTTHFSKGIYVVRITAADGKQQAIVKKIVVQ